jgi:hypothetical protein
VKPTKPRARLRTLEADDLAKVAGGNPVVDWAFDATCWWRGGTSHPVYGIDPSDGTGRICVAPNGDAIAFMRPG